MIIKFDICDTQAVAEIIKFEDWCFPMEMRAKKTECKKLLKSDATLFSWTEKKTAKGLMILVPEAAVGNDLLELDPALVIDNSGLYCYSIAVPRWHRGKGIGKALMQHAVSVAQIEGFSSLSAHMRLKNSWPNRIAKLINPEERRIVQNFWKKEGAVEFQRKIF